MGLGRASSIVIRVVFIMFSIDSAKEAPNSKFWGLQNHAPPELGMAGWFHCRRKILQPLLGDGLKL